MAVVPAVVCGLAAAAHVRLGLGCEVVMALALGWTAATALG